MPGGGSVTQEEYYGDVFALLKQGEVYLKESNGNVSKMITHKMSCSRFYTQRQE